MDPEPTPATPACPDGPNCPVHGPDGLEAIAKVREADPAKAEAMQAALNKRIGAALQAMTLHRAAAVEESNALLLKEHPDVRNLSLTIAVQGFDPITLTGRSLVRKGSIGPVLVGGLNGDQVKVLQECPLDLLPHLAIGASLSDAAQGVWRAREVERQAQADPKAEVLPGEEPPVQPTG